MTNTIQLDVREYLEIHYPKLSLEEIDLIASDIHRRWDYSPLESQVKEKIEETAYYANIKLHDNEKIFEPCSSRHFGCFMQLFPFECGISDS